MQEGEGGRFFAQLCVTAGGARLVGHGDRGALDAPEAEGPRPSRTSFRRRRSGDAIQKASARLAADGASAAASWWAEAPHARGSSSTRRRSARRRTGCVAAAPSTAYEAQDSSGSSTARNASHGRLTTGRSHLRRCPDRADDQRASDCFRRRALCMLACVVLGSCVHNVGFRPAVCGIRRPLFILGSHTTL